MSTDQGRKQTSTWLSGLLFFGAVALIVAGIMWLYPDSSSSGVAVDETTTTTISTTSTNDLDVLHPDEPEVDEPVADAAEVILPSVVHIRTGTGVGSGVVYADGLIMTAAHVVQTSETVRIRFTDGEQITGNVLGTAPEVDIAVIEVARDGLTPATFVTEKPRVGQMAIAVGSPWGLESTVTAGIISAIDQTNCSVRPESGEFNCSAMVQTDAAINPGNSGGPLVDRQGRVLGINVSIFTDSGANDGVGFAVPADIAVTYADAIVSNEPIETAFLGVQGDDVITEGQAGAVITSVVADSAAEAADIRVDDVVIGLDGVPIFGWRDLVAQVRSHQPGDTVEVLLLRDDGEITVDITLGVRTEDVG
ncbi:MAG TPA: trypsin-like peptidase domain-containing protein [Acidimicrobiia bacterium]|nr:trypsin-like peptidase domain-containing protein [Acidimicrobiia bacterium]